MFWITDNPSSGSLVQCLAKNYKNNSIVSVDMDKFGDMAAYSDPLCVYVHTLIVTRCACVHTHIVSEYAVLVYTHAHRARICCHNTDLVRVNGHDRIILVICS